MPVLKVINLNYQLSTGEYLFQDLSCSMTKSRVGLVGKNGTGKSVLASCLSGENLAFSGKVQRPETIAMYSQQPTSLLNNDLTLVQFLGVQNVLDTLGKIESGDCSEQWFSVVGEQWDLPSKLTEQLIKAGLPAKFEFPCKLLSGGQLAKLQLLKLFAKDYELLILDEPSNHLDFKAKSWLLDLIKCYDGHVLLISHDRMLLREVEEIWELSKAGIEVFGGDYDFYVQQKQLKTQANERHLNNVGKQLKQLQRQSQKAREKMEQRAAQGNKLRKQRSQAKVLLDHKKDKATASASRRNRNEQQRREKLENKKQQLLANSDSNKGLKLYINEGSNSARNAVFLNQVKLPFGNQSPLTFEIKANEKLHLQGINGSGKSTLLKTLIGESQFLEGECHINTAMFYLDQHFGLICPKQSLLDNLLSQCTDLIESDARTLLAGIGFKKDSVFRLGGMLSGGEKMKLSMLIISHQPQKPMLLLDEPDNHLDIESKEVLAEALHNYNGGFILVSHDDDFVAATGVTKHIYL